MCESKGEFFTAPQRDSALHLGRIFLPWVVRVLTRRLDAVNGMAVLGVGVCVGWKLFKVDTNTSNERATIT